MLREWVSYVGLALVASLPAAGQDAHQHDVPEKLGVVSFPTSCAAAVQKDFERGVALLHSFTYTAAEKQFREVAARDPQCAMAHWGMAMSHFHQLWEPPLETGLMDRALGDINAAIRLAPKTQRERDLVQAAALIYTDAAAVPYAQRALRYEQAMAKAAETHKEDVEIQVLYALALLANASPTDRTHARQKKAAELLDPLSRGYPQHPGIAHYLIHAYDNSEMAQRGLPAARAYSGIAPAAAHALHMPTHIFTRLGLWEDSISSNLAARDAAHRAGDTGEELHALDYLVYAYLQLGRESEAAEVIRSVDGMNNLNMQDFKSAYGATALRVRYLVERGSWKEAVRVEPPAMAPQQVTAIAVWARGIGLARSGRPAEAKAQAAVLRGVEEELGRSGKRYWVVETKVMRNEVEAWAAQAENAGESALALLREAADEEDAVEKLPVTPGPIVPAREQLGELLLQQGKPDLARKEFEAALKESPGRRGSRQGVARATEAAAVRPPAP